MTWQGRDWLNINNACPHTWEWVAWLVNTQQTHDASQSRIFYTYYVIIAVYIIFFLFCFFGSFLNSCGCSTAKSKTPPQETFFCPLNGTQNGSQPSLTTRDRELVSVLEVRIEPGDLNPRPLTPQSVTLPTLPREYSPNYFRIFSCAISHATLWAWFNITILLANLLTKPSVFLLLCRLYIL